MQVLTMHIVESLQSYERVVSVHLSVLFSFGTVGYWKIKHMRENCIGRIQDVTNVRWDICQDSSFAIHHYLKRV